MEKVARTSSKKEMGSRGRGGRHMGSEDAGRVVGLWDSDSEGNPTRLELLIDGLNEGEDKSRTNNNMGEFFMANPAELAIFAVCD